MRSDPRFRVARHVARPSPAALAEAGAAVRDALALEYSGVSAEPFAPEVVAVESDNLNAFAVPGGRIFVSDSLLQLLTLDELRAIVGHEYGHVLLRHGVKRLVQPLLF